MKRIIVATVLAVVVAISTAASAQIRDDIFANVIWPCVGQAAVQLEDEDTHRQEALATMIFVLKRDYYEEISNAVEAAFRQHADYAAGIIYHAGFKLCIAYQDTGKGAQ